MAASIDRLRSRLAERGTLRRYGRREALCTEGDVSDRVFLLEDGVVKVSCVSAAGIETVLGVRTAGDMVGEVSTLDGGPRSASVVAVTEVAAIVVPASVLRQTLAREPEAMRELVEVLVERLRDADRKRVEFAALDTVGRVATRALELADRFGVPSEDGVRIELPLSQEELASWCAASREATVKALRTLRELGYVATARHALEVRDLAALERLTVR
jgi:CRP/FNR family transcriptional regulator, cyclic AMP receptor protein